MSNNIKDYYLSALQNGTQYSGVKVPHKKVLSASAITKPVLELYLKYMEESDTSWEYSQSTIGSIYQLGVDQIFKKYKNVTNAKRFNMAIKGFKGWKLSGEIDQLIVLDGVNHIIDSKLLKYGRVANIIDEGKTGAYAIQLKTYEYLLKHSKDYNGLPIKTHLSISCKDATFHEKENKPSDYWMDVEILSDIEFERILAEKLEELISYIDKKETPPQCDNLFWSASFIKDKKTPMKCVKFCDYSDACPYFSSVAYKSTEDAISFMKSLGL